MSSHIHSIELPELALSRLEAIPDATEREIESTAAAIQTSLQDFDANRAESRRNQSELQPVDRGFGAFAFLFAAFIVDSLVGGFPTAYGVFLDSYLSDARYTSQHYASTLLPLAGTLSTGLIYCLTPLTNSFIARHPHTRRPIMWIGALLCVVSLLAASYTTQVSAVVVFQGILYAIRGSMLYTPCLSYMLEWFVERRGMANGVIFAGTAVVDLILPLMLPPILEKYGPSKTLRILSVGFAAALIPALPFIKGRLPEMSLRTAWQNLWNRNRHSHRTTSRMADQAWKRDPVFWFLLGTTLIQSFGFFVPIIWLPTFATDLNLSSAKSVIALSLLNGASMVGQLGMGVLSDIYNPWLLSSGSSMTAAFCVFVLWGVCSTGFGGLTAFGIAYGVLAGGGTVYQLYSFGLLQVCIQQNSLIAVFLTHILAEDDPTLASALFGYTFLTKGVGNILSAPISSALARGTIHTSTHTGFAVNNGRFTGMIVYAGSCSALAAVLAIFGAGAAAAKRRRSDIRERA